MIRWDKIAEDLKFPDEKTMWSKLYIRYSVGQLATRFGVSTNTVRKELRRHDIESRPRGGPNRQKIELDEMLLQELRSRGVLEIAKERDLDPTTIYKQLKKAGIDLKVLRQPVQESPQPSAEHQDAEESSDPDKSR